MPAPIKAHLADLLKAGRTAQPANLRIANQGTDSERYQAIPGMSDVAATHGEISLRQLLPQLTGQQTTLYSFDRGSSVTLEVALMNASIAAQFGARLIVIDRAPEPESNPLAGTYTRAGGFAVIAPADFQEVQDDTDATEQALPVSSSDIEMDAFKTYVFRTRISRRQQKAITDDEMSARLMTAISVGLANLADKVLFAKIADAVPATTDALDLFRLEYAAAKGLRFAELRGVVGSERVWMNDTEDTRSGNLNAYSEELRLQGVPVELSGQTDTAIIGAFNRAGVSLMDDLRLIVERGPNGALIVTCLADLQPLLPDPSYFWRA